jgi:hypothetical protein
MLTTKKYHFTVILFYFYRQEISDLIYILASDLFEKAIKAYSWLGMHLEF